MLQALLGTGSGVAAERDGRLVAYLGVWRFEARGEASVFSPEWANGADGHGRRRLIEELYAASADAWVRDGYRSHLISVLADDRGALDSSHWLGFGEVAADAIRGSDPVPGAEPVPALIVRRAGLQDLDALTAMEEGLRRHVAASPAFFRLGPPRSCEDQQSRLSDASTPIWMAELEGEAIAYLRIGSSSDEAATIIRDPETASISGAFTLAAHRRAGVATQLLNAAVAWGRQRGYRRVAVDHETANPEASRFWCRHFTYVTYSLGRRLSPATGVRTGAAPAP